jgi:uncharacterized protein YPO0396
MQSLFDNNSGDAGFRLHYLEVYNWGTFDSNVWRIQPNGNNSLLTGGNGSGKTTLVDGLLTLLVPSQKRFYNQSSGADRKKERDETSYVLGHYGRRQEEGASAIIEMLRDKSDYSVLLAYFENNGTKHKITLFQIRYWDDGMLKKLYGIAPTQLDIKTNIEPFHKAPEFKKRLESYIDKIEFPPSFEAYANRFTTLFGMRSMKALSLFSQTVGIKVLGNMNTFIREHMLDDQDVEEDFRKLRENFDTLIQSYNEIEKSKAQQLLLTQIKEYYDGLCEFKINGDELEHIRQGLPFWFIDERSRLLVDENLSLKVDCENLKNIVGLIEKTKTSLLEDITELKVALSTNSSYNRLNQLDNQITQLEDDKNWKYTRWQDYNKVAQEAGLIIEPKTTDFDKNRIAAQAKVNLLKNNRNDFFDRKATCKIELENANTEFDRLEAELHSYQERKNNIPIENAELRDTIARQFNLSNMQLPFAGELIRVKEEHTDWEDAAEKLLRNFGLTLLVPEQNYRKISEYINSNDMRKRVVYYKTNSKQTAALNTDVHPDMLFNKLDIKPSPFAIWIEQHLKLNYNYLCVSTIEELEMERKAMTKQGLIKNADRNEKDDRPFRSGKRNYILGWDNEQKIKAIKSELALLQRQIGDIERLINEIGVKIKDTDGQLTRTEKLIGYESYAEIDWMSVSKLIQSKKEEIETIKKSDKQVESLKIQIEAKEKERKGIEAEGIKQNAELTLAKDKIQRNEDEIRKTDETIPEDLDMFEIRKLVCNYFNLTDSIRNIATLDKAQKKYSEELKTSIDGNNIKLRNAERNIVAAMTNFVQPKAEILEKYPSWKGDIINLKAEIEYIDDFLTLYNNLDNKLPELKERFKKYMDESVIDKFTEFKTELTNRTEKIEDQIKELNKSLKKIDFKKHPQTYIQLQYRDSSDMDIRGFKEKLKGWQPNYGQMQLEDEEKIREDSFLKIRTILDELSLNDIYRRKVTDVKNWKEFSAKENNRENNEQVRYYPDSGSLSGGEKAQFTYTILGAALAYQFGISDQGMKAKSFRFIAVDEAFSKLDIDNSKYLMDLCHQLHLQLLVITPLDKIQVAEPYIHSCQYVQNKNKRNSEVFNLTMDQYFEKKKEFELEASSQADIDEI